jgi:hypothetical protein
MSTNQLNALFLFHLSLFTSSPYYDMYFFLFSHLHRRCLTTCLLTPNIIWVKVVENPKRFEN